MIELSADGDPVLDARYVGTVPVACQVCEADNAPGPYHVFEVGGEGLWRLAAVCSTCMTHRVTHRVKAM